MHGLHASVWVSSYLPAAQMLHAALPAPGCTHAPGHEVQDVAVGLKMYEPAPQQTAEPAGADLPAAQVVHELTSAPGAPNEPAAQQDPEPAAAVVPAHFVQPLWPACGCAHALGHEVQDVAAELGM